MIFFAILLVILGIVTARTIISEEDVSVMSEIMVIMALSITTIMGLLYLKALSQ